MDSYSMFVFMFILNLQYNEVGPLIISLPLTSTATVRLSLAVAPTHQLTLLL